MTEFQKICKSLGWKFTSQRYAIYKLLHGNTTHPSADMVREQIALQHPSISRDSVFRILNDFCNAGILSRMDFTDPVRFDGNLEPHHHFFCRKCGRILDFAGELPRTDTLDELGMVQAVEVRAVGICRACLAEEKKTIRKNTENKKELTSSPFQDGMTKPIKKQLKPRGE